MGRIRFASFIWLLLLPAFAVIKVVWKLNTPYTNTLVLKPMPIAWLDTQFAFSIFIGIACILLATYLVFAYINAFINLQTTYTTALFFGILTLISFTPELTSSLLGILLFVNGILRLLSLDEKKKGGFVVFDTGLLIGLSLIFEIYFIILSILLSIFLTLFRFSFREFLQYWAAICVPILFFIPFLYFDGKLPEWQQYVLGFSQSLFRFPQLNLTDYVLIGVLFTFCTLQAFSLYRKLRKPSERLLLFFLFIYFTLSLLIGIVAYPIAGAYVLFVIPSITILYSLSQHENHKGPIFLIFAISTYWILQMWQNYPILL